ncbi:molybdate/tungstate transport system ATP-binding protein [Desulfomicrobium norvegicum]|uniref:Molybdate/tungstate transport system ATP-binding protein n=1 Tax=Desulfomicrobium norvegicum (strain DSM 1741 / NCIMB 8310) TaxID=52561 RepID=A0A8G2C094_DESNO|nr:ABC transporter ATP-binding protein [Desulfomicrobium norvegicum]SFL31971.1 molybdate/tungstate transport system ATP-binding protein [Desulfomicrobium norvegicum]
MIRVESLALCFGKFSLRDVGFQVAPGEFFALMGPTGSGKTLILESIAGLVEHARGSIRVAGQEVGGLPPERRNVSLVYQDNALFPHLSVLDNVTYGQRYHGIAKDEGRRMALALLERLGLTRVAKRLPVNLSGGEKQRVSLARALACKPDVVLLDEPLSSLDPQFRDDLRAALKDLHRHSGLTFLMVTHDFVDALTLADRAAVLREGRLEQVGTVGDVFRKPATAFVAGFVGMKNIFSVEGQGECRLGGDALFAVPGASVPGHVALRPEDVFVSFTDRAAPGWLSLPGTLQGVRHEGFSWFAEVSCGHSRFTAALDRQFPEQGRLEPGRAVWLTFACESLHFMPDA